MPTRRSTGMFRPGGKRDRANRRAELTVAKMSLVSAVLAALIAGTATVVSAVITDKPSDTANPAPTPSVRGRMPEPTCAACVTGTTVPEQAGAGGAETFRDPRAFLGRGQRVTALQRVDVVCRLRAPSAPSLQAGWWYLVATEPWHREYYSPANSYLNGDQPDGTGTTQVDGAVPVC